MAPISDRRAIRPLVEPRPAPLSAEELADPVRLPVVDMLALFAARTDVPLTVLEPADDGSVRLRWCNRAFSERVGRAEEDLLGAPVASLLHAADRSSSGRESGPPGWLNPRRTGTAEVLLQHGDGQGVAVSVRAVPVAASGRRPAWVVSVDSDRALARIQEDLRASEARFRALADRAPVGIIQSESGLRLGYVNDAFADLFGFASESLLGTGWLARVDDECVEAVTGALQEALGGRTGQARMVLRADSEGRSREAVVRAVPVTEPGRPAGFVATVEDVTERRRYEAALNHAASHDTLTGLPNRATLFHVLRGLTEREDRAGLDAALLFVDLDDFKDVNDTLGHHAGDALLVEVAERLRRVVREHDLVARLGGDEFVVVAQGVGGPDGARQLAERVVAELRRPLRLEGRRVTPAASVGIALSGELDSVESWVREGDLAMYEAKARGKGAVVAYDVALQSRADGQRLLARDLEAALDAGAIGLAYQPVVTLGGHGRLVGVEALARWNHPVLGPVSPLDFVAVAERNGTAGRLGALVLGKAAAALGAARRRRGAVVPDWVSVNVSASHLADPGLPALVAEALVVNGLPGHALCIEITESVLVSDTEAAVRAVDALRAQGVRVAVDDFGAGYSSLSQLADLPVDVLKLDRGFTDGIEGSRHRAVVATVVALGRQLGLDVIAEGIETPRQLALLAELGCPLVQGYLVARPGGWSALPEARLIHPSLPSPRPGLARQAV